MVFDSTFDQIQKKANVCDHTYSIYISCILQTESMDSQMSYVHLSFKDVEISAIVFRNNYVAHLHLIICI